MGDYSLAVSKISYKKYLFVFTQNTTFMEALTWKSRVCKGLTLAFALIYTLYPSRTVNDIFFLFFM